MNGTKQKTTASYDYLEAHLSICFLHLILDVLLDDSLAIVYVYRTVDRDFSVFEIVKHRLDLIELVPLARYQFIVFLLLR